jgi:osmotically-inducible protein OsmY
MTKMVPLVVMVCFAFLMGFKGPQTTIPDSQIESAIKERLAMDGRVNPNGIEVKVNNGTVTLSGIVETMQEKALAENLVASTYGAKAVVNNLVVRPPVSKDDEIRKAVEETMKSTPALQKKDVQVDVSEGVVTLKGSVDTLVQSLAAENAAKTVEGAVNVVNMIKVVETPRPDREIEKDVVFYLKSSSLVNLDDIEVSVKDGVVFLKGTIENLSHRYVIMRDLEKVRGVRRVDVSGLTLKHK